MTRLTIWKKIGCHGRHMQKIKLPGTYADAQPIQPVCRMLDPPQSFRQSRYFEKSISGDYGSLRKRAPRKHAVTSGLIEHMLLTIRSEGVNLVRGSARVHSP